MKRVILISVAIFLFIDLGVIVYIWSRDHSFLGSRKDRGKTTRPNVVLVTVECIRADRVSGSGYERDTTPNTKRFFQRGVIFKNAIAPTSWTLPSMVSLFTSKYPEQHGSIKGFWNGDESQVYQAKISPELLTLPEELRRYGYYTYGFNSNPHLTRRFGFGEGIGRYDDFHIFAQAPDLIQKVLEIEDRLKQKQPYLVWIHFFDPHWPYSQHQPWINLYNPEPPEIPPRLFQGFVEVEIQKRKLPADHELIRYLSDAYDTELNYWDNHMTQLYRTLGQDENTMFIVASDHGEGFMEHDHMDHGYSLYSELTNVLFAIKFPHNRFAGAIVDRAVSLLDIAPTILATAGIPPNPEFKGENLFPLIDSETSNSTEAYVFSHLDNFNKNLRSVESQQWKLIFDLNSRSVQLFDKNNDPNEKTDVAATHPDVVSKLSNIFVTKTREIEAAGVQAPKEVEVVLTDEEVTQLRALGYL